MPVSRTNTKRYVALCELADCDWADGPHRHRVVMSERLRHHMKVQHGLTYVLPTEGTTRTMKTASQNLPKDESLDRLSAYSGQLIAVEKGWDYDPAYSTSFGPREAIVADVWVYDNQIKAWRNLAADAAPGTRTPIFFKTVIRQLQDEGNEDDWGGLLMQGAAGRRNDREWVVLPPTPAQVKLLEKFDPSL